MITLEQLEALTVYHRQTIPDSYLDVMGHMNIRWYMALYDEAAWRFFASFGMSRAYFEAEEAGAFALKQFIRYLSEVRVGETVAIRTRVLNRSQRKIHFMHFMINESSKKLAATMEVLGAHVDLKIRRTSPFAPEVAQQLDTLLAEHGRLPWNAPLSGAIDV